MSAPRPLARPRVRSRRAVVLGGAATLLGLGAAGAVAGCTVTDPDPAAPSGSAPGSGSPSGSAPAADGSPSAAAPAAGTGASEGTARDAALVNDVLDELAVATGVVLAARRGARRLRGDLRPLLVLHGEHVRLLGARLPVEPADAGGRRNARERLAAVRRGEQRLERVLADAAVAADSGPLARLLASMAAAVGQRLVVLPVEPR